jgi:hypothetical protein
LKRFDLRRYAVKGAEQRLLEVAEEAARIFAAFPELRGRGRGFDAVGPASNASSAPALPTRRKRKMSAAARKRISRAQKKRWAKLRKAQGKK